MSEMLQIIHIFVDFAEYQILQMLLNLKML